MIRERKRSFAQKKKKKKKGHTFLIFLVTHSLKLGRRKKKKREKRWYADTRQRGDLMGKLLPNTLPRDRIVTSNKSGFCDN